MSRYYLPRLSQKAVLAYLEDVYPEWVTFEKIYDGVPIMHVDGINLQLMLNRLIERGLVEREDEPSGLGWYRAKKD